MLKRLLTALRHPVSRNVIALYWVQIATFVVPLVTLPYVARVLDQSGFGLVIFAQGFAFVLVVFINWGMGLTGSRSTAASQSDPHALSEVVRGVRGGQLLLTAAAGVITLVVLLLNESMRNNPEFLVLAWVAAGALALTPNWFFVGLERARVTAIIQLSFRVAGAALTFVLVNDAGDAWIVTALFAGSAVGSLIVSDLVMYRDVEFRLPEWRLSVREIREGTMIFIGTLAVALVTSFNVVLLGFLGTSAEVAHFGAAERLVRVSITLLGPIGAAVIPRLTALQAAGERERARQLLKMAVAAAAMPALAITLVLIVFAPQILHLVYGESFVDPSTPILRVLALIIPVNVTGAVFGVWLMTLHRDRLIMTIAVVAGVANVVLGCVFTLLWGPIGMAWSVITAEAVGAVGGLVAVRRDTRRAVAVVAAIGTVALAAVLIGAYGGKNDTNDTGDFTNEASTTCAWASRSVDVVPQRSSRLLRTAAVHLRGVDAADAQRAADTLTAQLGRLSRSAGGLSSELVADFPDAARMRRLRAAVRGDQERVAATARTLGVSGCDAITAGLLREATASAPKRLSHAAYRSALRDGLADLSQRTFRVQASMRSGSASSSTLTSYAGSVGTAIERLRSLRPPVRDAQAHRELVAGLRALRAAIAQAARDLRAGSEQQAVATLQSFYASQAFSDLTAATSTLSRTG